MVRIRRSHETKPWKNANAGFAHQTLDTLSTDQDAFRSQLPWDPRAAVGLPVFIVNRLDRHRQSTVSRPPWRLSAIAPAEVALVEVFRTLGSALGLVGVVGMVDILGGVPAYQEVKQTGGGSAALL
jgi:hypothetical protein